MPRSDSLALDRRWRLEASADEPAAAALAEALKLPLPFARLLVQRGYAATEDAK